MVRLDREIGEPRGAFRAARIFVEGLNPQRRSIDGVRRQLGRGFRRSRRRHLWKLAVKYRWVSRAAEFDERVLAEEERRERRATARRLLELNTLTNDYKERLYLPFKTASDLYKTLIGLNRPLDDPELVNVKALIEETMLFARIALDMEASPEWIKEMNDLEEATSKARSELLILKLRGIQNDDDDPLQN